MEVSISDLFLAYRQAKISLYFEKRGVGLDELAKYENRLSQNLLRLQSHLREGTGWFDGIEPGQVWVVPKRTRVEKTPRDLEIGVTVIGTSTGLEQPSGLDIQIRMSPTPDFAIVEILYLWQFGPRLDSLIPKESVGYRLNLRDGMIPKHARWVFEYWPKRYNEFRREGLKAAQEALANSKKPVDILSADLASFYDTVDGAFLIQDSFVSELSQNADDLPEIDVHEYMLATKSLLSAHARFHRKVLSNTGLEWSIGVPIGALSSRVMSFAVEQHRTLARHMVCRPHTGAKALSVIPFVYRLA